MEMSPFTRRLFAPDVLHAQGNLSKVVGQIFKQLAPTPSVLGAAMDAFAAASLVHLAAGVRAWQIDYMGAIHNRFGAATPLGLMERLQKTLGRAIAAIPSGTMEAILPAMYGTLSASADVSARLDAVWRHIDGHALDMLTTIDTVMRTQPVSDEKTFPNPAVCQGAELVTQLMGEAGFIHCETIRTDNSNPLVFGATSNDPAKPTLLLYAHYDVQPADPAISWETDPFVATMRNGRMYGRGAADDLAGLTAALAVVKAYRATGDGELPVNVAVVFEGEEEVGSKNMGVLLSQLREHAPWLNPDAVLLTDMDNALDGLPTVSLSTRGVIGGTIQVRTITHAHHSGTHGFYPNAYTVLCSALAAMTDSATLLVNIPGVTDIERPMPEFLSRSLAAAPHAALDALRRDTGGLLPGVPFVGRRTETVRQQAWGFSQVNLTDFSDTTRHGGVVIPAAGAKFSVRIPPRVDAADALQRFEERLREVMWPGVELMLQARAIQSWSGDIDGHNPLTPLLGEALSLGYGRSALFSGCGGTIGFLDPFSKAFPRAALYGVGVEDPDTRAHSPNESLGLDNLFGTARGIAAFVERMGAHARAA